VLTVRSSIAYSIILHITLFIIVLLVVSPVKDKKGEEFFARLVTTEEFLPSTPPTTAMPRARSFTPAKPKSVRPKLFRSAPQMREKGAQTVPGQGLPTPQPFVPHPVSPLSPDKGLERGSDIHPEIKGNSQIPNTQIPSVREKLFDKNIIGDIAKKEVKKEEKDRQTFSFDVKEMRYLAYLRRLKERIESIWIYPPDAAAKGIYGDLLIKFTIKKNGKLGAAEVVRTSGYKTLDDAALRALRDAEPFWPLPDEWGMEAYTIEGYFVYTIYGYYVR